MKRLVVVLALAACSGSTTASQTVLASIELLSGDHTVQGWLYPSPTNDTLPISMTGISTKCVRWSVPSEADLPDSVIIDADVSGGNQTGHTHAVLSIVGPSGFHAWQVEFTVGGSTLRVTSSYCR